MSVLSTVLPVLPDTADFEVTEISEQFFVVRDKCQEEERSILFHLDEVLMQCIELGYHPKKHTFMFLNTFNSYNAVVLDAQIRMKAMFNFETSDLASAKQLCAYFIFNPEL